MPEMLVIALVALLVLGPKRLPGAARAAGALIRRAQRSWSGLRADIERELAADDMKRQLEETQRELAAERLKRELQATGKAISESLDPTSEPRPSLPKPTSDDDRDTGR